MTLIKNILLVAFLVLVVTTFEGCAAASAEYVYAIERTRTFHRPDCAPVHMARTVRMTLSEAMSEHLRPCPVCRPDKE